MWILTTQNFCVEHVREGDVIDVLSLPEPMEATIGSARALPHCGSSKAGLTLWQI